MTDNILKFPDHSRKIRQAVKDANPFFRKQGLDEVEASAAANQLGEYFARLLGSQLFTMEVPAEAMLTPNQAALVTAAHNECFEIWAEHHKRHMTEAFTVIGDLLALSRGEHGTPRIGV